MAFFFVFFFKDVESGCRKTLINSNWNWNGQRRGRKSASGRFKRSVPVGIEIINKTNLLWHETSEETRRKETRKEKKKKRKKKKRKKRSKEWKISCWLERNQLSRRVVVFFPFVVEILMRASVASVTSRSIDCLFSQSGLDDARLIALLNAVQNLKRDQPLLRCRSSAAIFQVLLRHLFVKPFRNSRPFASQVQIFFFFLFLFLVGDWTRPHILKGSAVAERLINSIVG